MENGGITVGVFVAMIFQSAENCGTVGALLLVLFTFMSKASDTSGPTSGPIMGYTRQQVRCMFGRWVHSGGE